jgi:2,3-bisphosphoglycerate-dependent phosphoglycerate mutase
VLRLHSFLLADNLEPDLLSEIYLIRHGDPARDPAIPYTTHPGPNLSDRGRNEARAAAAFLADKGLEQLFSSPFARTTQTAEIISEQLGLPIISTKLIQEHGPGESDAQVRERLREFFTGAQDSFFTRIGLVTHGSPVRASLLELSKDQIDLSKHNYAGGNPAPTCGIWQARWLDEHHIRFELVFKPT